MTDFRFKGSIEIEGKSYRIKAKGKLEEKEPSEPPTEPPTEPERPPVDPPPSGQSVKPYGPYARFGQGDMSGYPGQGEWNKTDHPRCRGAVVIFMWRSLEQGEGDYNLTAIGAAMDECARRGIKLGVYIRDYAFSGPGDEPKNSHPDYVLNNPGRFGGRAGQGGLFLHSNKDFNNGKHTKGTNRYRTAFWIPEVTDRRVALLKAVFAYIDAHPNRNVVTFVNNAASTSGGSLRTSEWDDVPAHQYSPEKLRDEHLRYLDAVAPLRLPGGANFCFNGELIPESPTDKDGWQIYLRDIYDRCAEYQIGWCQPDPKKVKATFNGGNYANETICYGGLGHTWTYDHGESAANAWSDLDKLYGSGNSLEDHCRVFIAPSVKGGLHCSAMAFVTHYQQTNPTINYEVWMGLADNDDLDDDLREELEEWAEAPDDV